MDDTISRQEAIDEFPEDNLPWDTFDGYVAPHLVRKILERLPSAQPEIIRCKDCRNNHWCNIQEAAMAGDNFFCGAAERRTDEKKNI